MNGLYSLQELLTQLYHYRDDLKYIFSRQLMDEPVNYFEFINDNDKERMFYIFQEWGILFVDDNLIRLDTHTYDFFAQKLNVNKIINVSDVQDLIADIRNNIQYSRQDSRKSQKYILHIREMFYSVERKTRITIQNLRNNIDDTYKQVAELEIKQKELDKLDEKRKAVQGIVSQTLELLSEEKDFFCNNGLENRIHQLSRTMVDYGIEVSELHNLIINYLFRVEKQTGIVQKVKKLRLLLDRHVLEVATDVDTVLSLTQGLPIDGMERKETKLSLDWLKESDEALDIIDKVRQEIVYFMERKPAEATAIEKEYLDRQPVYEDTVDYETIKDGFLVQKDELLKYICSYPFGKEMTPDDYLDVFMIICSTYMEFLDITGDFDYYNDVRYRIIKPLEK